MCFSSESKAENLIKVLIIDGMNNHNWQATTSRIKGDLPRSYGISKE
jgi:hypothetical protein